MRWIMDRDAEGYGDFLARTFPRFAPELLVDLVNAYRRNGMWTTPRIDRAAYDRWQKGIADGYLIDAPIDYDKLIDVRPLKGLAA
jgi:NitT/TauT family transport system substrate-binding protein